jgi:hypothetical protein
MLSVAAVEDTIIVAPVLAEDATSVAATAPPEDTSTAAAVPRRRPHALVPSWLSKLGCRRQSRHDNTNQVLMFQQGLGS